MKLPTEITSRHRLRDIKICNLYIEGKRPEDIVDIIKKYNYHICLSRCYQILSNNNSYINPRIAWPKSKRIHRRQELIEKSPQISKKDIIDQLDGLQREIEGNKPQVEQHIHITNFKGFIEDAYNRRRNNNPLKLSESSKDTN